MTDAGALVREAMALAKAGDDLAAESRFAVALATFPNDARVANSAGNFHARARRNEAALVHFLRALELDPNFTEAAANAGIVYLRLDQPEDLLHLFASRLSPENYTAQLWALRADAERLTNQLTAASASYAEALGKDPANKRALAGRARLSLERGEARAVADFQQVLAKSPGDPEVFCDYIEALLVNDLLDEARQASAVLISQLPGWPRGQVQFAELEWAAGDREGFDRELSRAAETASSPELYMSWGSLLAGAGQHQRAAEILDKALAKWPGRQDLALNCAICLGEAGETQRAGALYQAFDPSASLDWSIAYARHLIQLGAFEEAERLLGGITKAEQPSSEAWALIDICWRTMDDPRHAWLHGQEGLVQNIALDLSPGELNGIAEVLLQLHQRSFEPFGQSIKGGSQTKGALLHRLEPELQVLKTALTDALQSYRAALPPRDERHPLLSRRDSAWEISGSWSILMNGTGQHVSHVHPQGVLSSACYIILPDNIGAAGQGGLLELGRPPALLASQLDPLATIRPAVGHCALFPSTLFHGTQPISGGRRMSVAFDVKAVSD